MPFTLFFHGTGQHRSNRASEEVIHALSEKAAGTEYTDFLILDGPGSGVKTDTVNRMAGTFDAFDKNKGAKGSAPSYSQTNNDITDMRTWRNGTAQTWVPGRMATTAGGLRDVFVSGGGSGRAAATVATVLAPITALGGGIALSTSSGRGNILGEGMDDNIRHAMAAMGNKWTDFNGQTVNMVGWSRGAITAIRAANWIQEFYGSGVNVNIFAFDPVAGGDLGTSSADTYTIPSVVKNFVGLLAMDEKRGGFRPQDINRFVIENRDATKFALLPIPGAHDTQVKLGKSAEYPEVAQIGRYMGYKFLQSLGSTFKSTETMYSAVDLCEKYASTKGKLKGYAKLGKKGIKQQMQGGLTTRDVATELDRYMSHSTAYFINEHHIECFKAAFPTIYALFFTNSPPLPPNKRAASSVSLAASTDLGRALQAMYQSAPASCELLMAVGVLNRRSTGLLGTGPAVWTIKPCGLYQGDNGAMISGRSLLRTLMG